MNKIKVLLKQNRFLYLIYHYLLSFFLKFIGLFIKIDNNLIIFNSFGGKRYDDSPKAIYLYMKSNPKYKNYKLIWSLDDPSIVDNSVLCVKNNTMKFFITALKAKYWITNSSLERGLKFKKKKTIYINTWHGTALKKLGNDLDAKNMKFITSKADIYYAQSKYDVDIFNKSFNWEKDKIKIVGLPRNDELVNINNNEIIDIKNRIKLPLDKKIILYAPTFREFDYDKNGCFLKPPIDIKKWNNKLSNDYIILFRAHYEVNKVLNIKNDGFIYDMSNYPNLNELLKISDILISDYSSIMIDYSILERPIYAYTYDYEIYNQKRGLYIDLNNTLPNGITKNEDELLNEIINCDFNKQKEKTIIFKNKFIEKCGSASKYIDEIIK